MDVSDELKQTLRANWIRSDGTKDYMKELAKRRDEFLSKAMNLSVSSPLDKELIHINVCQAKTLSDLIKRLEDNK